MTDHANDPLRSRIDDLEQRAKRIREIADGDEERRQAEVRELRTHADTLMESARELRDLLVGPR